MQTKARRYGTSLVELLVVLAIMAVLMGLLLAAVQQARAAAARAACLNNLRQVGLALHHYHEAQNVFPPGINTSNAKSEPELMTWLARLLPYIEQESLWTESLAAYRVHRSPFQAGGHKGLGTVQKLFLCPADGRIQSAQVVTSLRLRVAFTSYLGVEGTGMRRFDGMLFADSRTRLLDATDGASQTLLVGERPPSADLRFGWWYAGAGQRAYADGSCDSVLGVREWNELRQGCPFGPYEFQPGRLDNPCDVFRFWSLHSGGSHFLLVDGSVRFLSYTANALLPALATRAGREVVSVGD